MDPITELIKSTRPVRCDAPYIIDHSIKHYPSMLVKGWCWYTNRPNGQPLDKPSILNETKYLNALDVKVYSEMAAYDVDGRIVSGYEPIFVLIPDWLNSPVNRRIWEPQ